MWTKQVLHNDNWQQPHNYHKPLKKITIEFTHQQN